MAFDSTFASDDFSSDLSFEATELSGFVDEEGRKPRVAGSETEPAAKSDVDEAGGAGGEVETGEVAAGEVAGGEVAGGDGAGGDGLGGEVDDGEYASFGGDDDEEDEDDEEAADDDEAFDEADFAAAAMATAEAAQAADAAHGPMFDIATASPLSFAVLQDARASVFATVGRAATFRRAVEALDSKGEPGRRRALGQWVLGRYEACATALANYAGDDVADFTGARALTAIDRWSQAQPLFQRLAKAYPDEPRPLGGLLEAEFELALLAQPTDPTPAADALEQALDTAPEGFLDSAEGHYLQGRLCEVERDFEPALDHYNAARRLDPTLRGALIRGAYLAERSGLDHLAVDFYTTAVQMKLADRAVYLNLGVLYEDLGRDQDAAACYDVVLKNFPADQRARRYLEDAKSSMDMYYDEDLERKEDKLNQILRIPITDFELSVRARNCLNKMQIHTLGDLVTKTEQELLSYKNFGETSLNEIKEILRSKGLRLGMPREEAVASIEARTRRPIGPSGESNDVTMRPITDLALSIRARRTVESLGCLTLGDITKHSGDELLGMPNFGSTSLQELRSKLTEHGLKLAGD